MRTIEEIIITIDIETIEGATMATESVDTDMTANEGEGVTTSGGENTATTGDRAIAVNE
jgi:pyruvate-formate lyase-activating enzyme